MELSHLRRGQRRSSSHAGPSEGGRRLQAEMAAGNGHLPRHTRRNHLRLPDGRQDGVLTRDHSRQSGQVMVLVAVALMAMIASVALILLAGSVEWQKNQLQELADSAALDSALKIGVGCDT